MINVLSSFPGQRIDLHSLSIFCSMAALLSKEEVLFDFGLMFYPFLLLFFLSQAI
jgi:hypothetical protein